MRRMRILGLCVAVLATLVLTWRPAAGAADPTVAVALFYATTPVNTYSGLVPEEYASADLSARLAAASGGRFAVVPRDRVRAQEAGLRWRESDVLQFARLSALARAANADSLVVGWIESLVLDRFGGGGKKLDFGGEGGGVLSATAVVVIEVFDASQGRIVQQVTFTGHAAGAVTASVVQGALDDAVRHAAGALTGPLAGAPGAK